MELKYFDITEKLLDTNTIDNKIFSIFPDNGKYLDRFNPSIIYLDKNLFLLSYRIWLDIYSEDVREYPNLWDWGSPTVSEWYPYTKNEYDEYNVNHELDGNLFGLAILKIEDDDIKVIHDQIIKLHDDDNITYMEDGRLFKDKDNIIRIIIVTYGKNYKDYLYKESRNAMTTFKIGSVDYIINSVLNKKELYIDKPILLCPHMLNLKVEKNWITWKSSDNRDYFTYFIMPNGTTVAHIEILNYEDQDKWDFSDEKNIEDNLYYLKDSNFKISLCNIQTIIYETIKFYIDINKYYLNNIKFSSGSCGIYLNENTNIFIGHANINIKKIKNYVDNNYISIEYFMDTYDLEYKHAENLWNNIIKFYEKTTNPNNEYLLHHDRYAYYMYYYTQNSQYPYNIKSISDLFQVKYHKYNNGVQFPCGLEIVDEDVYVSYGESDNRVCIYKTFLSDVISTLKDINDTHPLDINFIN